MKTLVVIKAGLVVGNILLFYSSASIATKPKQSKTLSATDVSVPITMKNAAKCDT
jgi:hypothetical protein